MSVTVTINDNAVFCEQSGTVKIDFMPCWWCEQNGGATPDCPHCGGSGEEMIRLFPHEMNVANGNFRTLWMSLGLEPGEYLGGEINAVDLLNALRCGDSDLVVKDGTIEKVENGPTIIEFGICREQADRYHAVLKEIATAAKERGELVVWS